MKSKHLETQIRRHPLVPAFGDEETVNYPVDTITVGELANTGRRPSTKKNRGTLLLVSDDASLGVSLYLTANRARLAFAQISDPAQALRHAGQDRPAVVFLDLDLPALAGWAAAERFLQDEKSPSLVLLTGQTNHFDLGAAVRSGALVDKSARPEQLLERVGGILAELDADRVDRKVRQRLLLRWLRPYDWPAPVIPVQRHWGINE